MDGNGIRLKMIQLSDLHIQEHDNRLEPMIDTINREDVELVIVTGDVVHSRDRRLYEIASDTLNKIRHRVIVLPGDYDNGDLFEEFFGNHRLKSIDVNGYYIDFLDTSFMKHRYSIGWGDAMAVEDKEQHEWLLNQINSLNGYHFIFSHHPVWVTAPEKSVYANDNVRAIFSGHLHEPNRFYFEYKKPRSTFKNGVAAVTMKFHGSSCYMVFAINDKHELLNIPRVISGKKTAW